MVPKENRLLKTSEFKRVKDRRLAHAHPLMVLWAVPNAGERLRFGFSVGRSVGGAVVRNRMRRKIRAAAMGCLPRLRKGHDIVVALRPPAAEADFPALQRALEALCRRAGLMEEEVQGK